MSVFKNLAEIGPLPIWSGVAARAVEGREMTLAVVELEPNSHVSQHQHPNEQIGVVLKGTMTFTIGGEKRDLAAGDTYCIPGNVPHEALTGPDGAVVIDCFAPVRADWKKFAPEAPSRPVWP
jgi:quercetin dioxygenase-like cupin family protein